MISVQRSDITTFCGLCAKAGMGRQRGSQVSFFSQDGYLHLFAGMPRIALRSRLGSHDGAVSLAVPYKALVAAKGRQGSVSIRETDQKVLLSWEDAGIPQYAEHDLPPAGLLDQKMPGYPDQVVAADTVLLASMTRASGVSAKERVRYALDQIQLRACGQVIGTDGQQLLIEAGYSFPWRDDVLLPAAAEVFGWCHSAACGRPINLGYTDGWAAFDTPQWTLWLACDTESRYPQVSSLIPDQEAATCRLDLDAADAEFLSRTMLRLSCLDRENAVTLELASPRLRARSPGSMPPTELVLARSTTQGQSMTLVVDRTHLARAVDLGCRQLLFYGSQRPVLALSPSSQYVFSVLDPAGAVAATADTVSIRS